MADPIFYVIPNEYLITAPPEFAISTGADLYNRFEDIHRWGVVKMPQFSTTDDTVVIEAIVRGSAVAYQVFYAKDGPWKDQLLALSTDPGIGQRGFNIAAGGLTGEYDPPVASPPCPAPGDFVLFPGPYTPYVPQSNVNVDFSDPGYITIDWQTSNPTADVFFQVYATLNVKAASNNAEYGVGFLLNGVINANTIVRVLKETPSDTEEITLHGHRPVPNGSKIGIGMTDYNGTTPPEVVSVNIRAFGFYYGT